MFLSTEKQIPVQLTFCPPNNIRVPYKSPLRIYTETVEQGKKLILFTQKIRSVFPVCSCNFCLETSFRILTFGFTRQTKCLRDFLLCQMQSKLIFLSFGQKTKQYHHSKFFNGKIEPRI